MGKKRVARKARKRTHGRYKESKVPKWFRTITVNERRRSFTFKLDLDGFLREVEAKDNTLTIVVRPKTGAKKGPGPYDYTLEVRVGNLVIPGPLSFFFPDEKTHGKEFFEKITGMLREAGALKKKGRPCKS